MPFIITDPCIETKDTACVDVCPVDCIHPFPDWHARPTPGAWWDAVISDRLAP